MGDQFVSPPTRKIALSLFVGLLAVSAGCSALQDSKNTSDNLVLVNQDNANHAVVIEISQGEELIYSTGRTLEAESDTHLESFTQNGEFQVAVTVDGKTTVKTYTFPSDDSATTIGVNNDGNVTIGT